MFSPIPLSILGFFNSLTSNRSFKSFTIVYVQHESQEKLFDWLGWLGERNVLLLALITLHLLFNKQL
jgi:hypothetical protein